MPRKRTIADMRASITDDGRLKYASDLPAPDDDPPDDEVYEVVNTPHLTANQLVAYNLQRARKARGWSQEYLGTVLAGMTGRTWSRASVSAAESSWRGGRLRRFDANELLAFSVAMRLPIGHFFLPPEEEEWERADFLADTLDEIGIQAIRRGDLLSAIWDVHLPAEFVDRLRRQFQDQNIEWQPGAHSITIPLHGDDLERFVSALEDAGVKVNKSTKEDQSHE